jgi:uncharacterized protein YndB with AHSA1/START domain
MPTFDDSTTTTAPVEEVWKLLYDPARFPEWWEGVGTVETTGQDGEGDFTLYPSAYPDFPMPQQLRSDGDGQRLTISCLVYHLVFAWRLEPLEADDGTRISVHVEIPEEEAKKLDMQRERVSASLRSLAALSVTTDGPRAPG